MSPASTDAHVDRGYIIPLGGAARHNVANSLAAAALAWSTGIDIDALRDGLLSMSQDANPGRRNVITVDGVTVLVDFAHNPRVLEALLDLAGRLDVSRKALCFGQAGDRPDELLRCGARPDQIVHHKKEVESFDAARAWAGPGDLVILLALERSPELYDRLRTLAS